MADLDSVALINAVADLSEILGRRDTIDTFLYDLVQLLAEHTRTEVCSVYLYDDEAKLLVLRATSGLNSDFVGQIQLKPGEGLTGYTFLQEQPVFERQVTRSDYNLAVPGFGDEAFPAFVGIPIKRHSAGIGVLVLQDRNPDKFDEYMIRTLRAIGSHLAAILENAAVLYEIHPDFERTAEDTEQSAVSSGMLTGSSASGGFGIGRLEYLDTETSTQDRTGTCSLEEAIEKSYAQLQELGSRFDQSLSDVAALIFSSHLLMLRDDSFSGEMLQRTTNGVEATAAVQAVVDDFVSLFSALDDERFQEKVQDVRDLGRRIIRNLIGRSDDDIDYRGRVVVAKEIFPSELVKLFLQRAEGVVFPDGGATAHISILAQSLQFPAIAVSDPQLFAIPGGTLVVLDGEDGRIAINPNEDILKSYRRRAVDQRRNDSAPAIPDVVSTPCGTRITLYANVNLVKDALAAERAGAHGIGLYRSEIPFLIRNDFPTEEEQLAVYSRVVQALPDKPIHFRTLDLGGDKLLSSQVGDEANPFLGFRGIRFLLAHPEIFQEQLRAMLRAGYGREIGIQFPMIASMDEVLAAKHQIRLSLDSLKKDRIAHNRNPRIGVMIELPAAVEIIAELQEEVDFLSVGTNDLIMYLLAADRANNRVAGIYDPLHPAVLRSLQRVVRSVDRSRKELTVCGSSAEDPVVAVFLLGLGMTTFSVSPHRIHPLHDLVRRITVSRAREYAEELLAAPTLAMTREIARRIRSDLAARQPDT